MPDYRRVWVPGGTFFFTVNLLERRSQRLLVERIDMLRDAFREVQRTRPFDVIAIVVLPEHLHCLWRLPEGDADNADRWARIKSGFSRRLPKTEYRSATRISKRERGIWQRRFWEHMIVDENDLQSHVDYIHYNPVKHGYVSRAAEWPYSSVHRYIASGDLPADWACDPVPAFAGLELSKEVSFGE
jgi:putative transposase